MLNWASASPWPALVSVVSVVSAAGFSGRLNNRRKNGVAILITLVGPNQNTSLFRSQSRARATPIHDTKYCRRRREESLFSYLSRNNKTPHVISSSFMKWPWGPPRPCLRGGGELFARSR